MCKLKLEFSTWFVGSALLLWQISRGSLKAITESINW